MALFLTLLLKKSVINVMSEPDRKKELILDSAIKLFAHYGIQKTTMNEIADALSVSQPALYHYFPDKMSLILAVVERIMSAYLVELKKLLSETQDLMEAFFSIIELRKQFLEKYFMLGLSEVNSEAGLIHDACRPLIEKARLLEIEEVEGILKSAIKTGQLPEIDSKKMSTLYFDTLSGLTTYSLLNGKAKLFPKKEDFEIVLSRHKDFTEIFILGLRNFEHSDKKP